MLFGINPLFSPKDNLDNALCFLRLKSYQIEDLNKQRDINMKIHSLWQEIELLDWEIDQVYDNTINRTAR